jgi:hypothetical protein
VDSISGVLSGSGVVIIGFTQSVLQVNSRTEMTPHRKVVLRLAIPAGAFPGIADFFKSQHGKMVEDGTFPGPSGPNLQNGTISE